MWAALGAELSAPAEWLSDGAQVRPDGDLARIFLATPNVHKWLHYLPIYEHAFARFRERPIKFLEIGVARGGSIDAWRSYFHADSIVAGIDVKPDCSRFDNPAKNVHIRIGAQQDVAFLRSVVDELGPFDAVLDDGSHVASHMIESFRFLFANGLRDGGVYVAEDVHANYWTRYRDARMSFIDFAKGLVDLMHAHYQSATDEQEFRLGSDDRRRVFTVPRITRILDKIEFFDSVIVLHRADGPRALPRTVYT